MENLHYFLKICECKSFSAASEELHLSQAALSSSIKKLEESLNAKLFVRHRRGVYLTDLGEQVFPHIEKIVSEYHVIEQLCKPEKSTYAQIENMNILTHPFVADTCISELSALLIKNHPEFHIQIREASVERCLTELKNQDYDLILVPIPDCINDLSFLQTDMYDNVILGHDYLAIEMHISHPFSYKKSIPIKDLLNTNIVFINQNHEKDASVASYYFDIHQLKNITETDNFTLYRKYIANGFVAFTFNNLRKKAVSFFEKDIIVKSLSKKYTFTYYAFIKPTTSPLKLTFIEKLLTSSYFKFQ